MNFPELAALVLDIHRDYFDIDCNGCCPIPVASTTPGAKSYHDYIVNAVSSIGICDVALTSVDYQHTHILGRFQRYGDRADVLISNRLNTCWSRYIAAKEMSHLIVDRTAESMTTDVSETVEWMINMGMEGNINKALDSEHIAAQFAIEVLVPYSCSTHMLKDSEVTSYEIASHFSVPERIIDAMRIDAYLDMRDMAYKDM